MATQTIAPPSAAPIAKPSDSSKWIWLGLAVVVGLAIALMPTPNGLTVIAKYVLAVSGFTVVLWATPAMNNGVASVLMMALMVLVGVRPPLALSGFSAPPWWILLCVLYYGFAMKKTGLAERLSYYILSLFPGSYAGILSAFFVIGFILALGIPSMTVRTAIMTPIAWALVQSLGLPKRSKGSGLIILTTVEMAVIPGLAFLYGSLDGPVVVAAFATRHLPLTWLGYAQVMTFPTLLLCVMILIGNQIALRPEAPLQTSSGFAKDRLRALGSFKRDELITAIVVIISIGLWTTKLPSFMVGMIAMAIFAVAGILRDEDIGTGVSWTLLLFIGGILGLANVVQEYKITDWLATYFVPIAQRITFSVTLIVIVMALIMYLMRFLDPSAFIAIPVLFLTSVGVTMAAGLPPLVLMAPLLIASVPFWLSYENFWIAMGEGITSNDGFTTGQRVRLANTYAVLALVSLVISVGYWKLAGVIK
jgi:divalent anion:Na+ symporter, DASS family